MTRLGLVTEAAPGIDGLARAKFGTHTVVTTVRGTTTAFLHVRQFTLRAGRFLDADDNEGARRVAVLGARVADNLFPGSDALDQPIRIRGIPFDVIGVLEARGVMADGDQDNQIVVPVRTALRRLFNVTSLSAVFVGVESSAHLDRLQSEITTLLLTRHRLDARGEPDFAIQDPAKPLAAQKRIADSLSLVTTLLASLGLFVGGAGILALMLLSVKERTSEIGLRIAIGATPRDIIVQFLIEAACLALGGWMAGVAVGAFAGTAIAIGTQWTLAVPLDVFFASLAMAVTMGLGFGAFPARKAARVPPIRALLMK
jgi:putative ABC transport system permease protein